MSIRTTICEAHGDGEVENLREQKAMADGCLVLIAEKLAALGCCHGHDGKGTPPMMYPEWIECVVAHHVQAADAEVARLRGIVDKLPKTADGVPVTPYMRVFYYSPVDGSICEGSADSFSMHTIHKTFSTREAAEAAKGAKP